MNNLDSLFFYLFWFTISSLFFYLFTFYFKNKKSAILFCVFAVGILCFISALRGNVGTDFATYESVFNYIREHDWNFSKYPSWAKLEYGFMGIVKIVALFFSNPVIWCFITAIFSLLCVKLMLSYDRCKNYSTIVAYVYMLMFFYANSFNIARQMLAFSICLFAMNYLFKNDRKYFLCILIAFFVHKSALLAVVFWFLWNHKENRMISKRMQVVIFAATVMIAVTYRAVLNFIAGISIFNFLQKYTYTLKQNQGGNRTFILFAIFALLVMFFSKKLKIIDKRNELYIFLLYLNVAIGIAALSNKFIYRIIMYFQMGYITVFPYLPGCFKESSRPIVKFGLCMVAVIYFVLMYYVLGNAEIIPYRFYWEIK